MKLLLDQNLAPALARRLADVWPGSRHVRDCGLERGSDLEVWMYAIQEAFVIVSKDADFHQLSFLKGAPPKVIWVRRGNCATGEVEQIIRDNDRVIRAFLEQAEGSFLAIR